MALFTILSDWKIEDFYLSALKARIETEIPDSRLVVMNQSIDAFQISKAAFVFRAAMPYFPDGSIHLIAVATHYAQQNNYLLVKYRRQFIILADNSMLGLIIDEAPEFVYKINKQEESVFAERDIMLPAAILLATGKSPDEIGIPCNDWQQSQPYLPVLDEHQIEGTVVYIDSYQNVITNISRNNFEQICQNRKFEILVASNYNRINKICRIYSEVPVGDLVAVWNSLDLLEVAIYKGHVAELLSLSVHSTIRIKFEN